jgi:hypothetical protein
MQNDRKPGIRIIVERVSVTTIRTRSKKFYCDACRRSLGADEIHLAPLANEPRDVSNERQHPARPLTKKEK